MAIKFRVGPSGLARVWIPPRPKGLGGIFMDRENDSHSHPVPDPVTLEPAGGASGDSDLDYRSELETFEPVKNRVTVFGNNARRSLREAGAALEATAGAPTDCVFLTGTLPSVEPLAWAALAEYSPWIVHRLKAWVNKYAPSKLDFYVWEWQGRGALHLHYCCLIPDQKSKAAVLARFQQRWVGWLHQIQEMSGVFMFRGSDGRDHSLEPEKIQAHAVEVEKSVSCYLSKYMGKAAAASAPPGADFFYPSRWWGVSRPLNAIVRSMTVSGVLKAARRKPLQVYEEIVSSARRVASEVWEWKNRVGEGENMAAVFPTRSEALDWLNNLGEGIMAEVSGLTPRAIAVGAVHEAEKWLEHLELLIPGEPQGDDAKAMTLINQGLSYASLVMDSSAPQPYAALSSILFELMMLVSRLRQIIPCRTDELSVRNLRLKIQVGLKAIRPLVYSELMVSRESGQLSVV